MSSCVESSTDYCVGVFTAKGNVKLNDVLGFVIGVATIALYNMNGAK